MSQKFTIACTCPAKEHRPVVMASVEDGTLKVFADHHGGKHVLEIAIAEGGTGVSVSKLAAITGYTATGYTDGG